MTVTINGCWKNSCGNFYKRQRTVNAAADYIIWEHRNAPEHLWEVTTETLNCHGKVWNDLPVHFDPFFGQTLVLFATHRLRWCLWREHGQTMSEHLLFKIALSAHLDTNNLCRFSKFSDKHFESWMSVGVDPIPASSTFYDKFQECLTDNCNSFDGNRGPSSVTEGLIQCQTSRSNPTLLSKTKNDHWHFHHVISSTKDKQLSIKEHRWLIKDLDGKTSNVSKLKLQKAFQVVAAFHDKLHKSYLNMVLQGSEEAYESLKKLGFQLEHNYQMTQIIN